MNTHRFAPALMVAMLALTPGARAQQQAPLPEDNALEGRVVAALSHDRAIRTPTRIQVRADTSGAVTLTGDLGSNHEIGAAVATTKRVEGVRALHSGLVVNQSLN
ncbi:BON domain-containing protein [Burkholderia sp. FERM BP-3421]|jgi:osmotically-inducible protein OsmY|uniref:BON domain-containing protein n=1 Tax=Burkholderia sp. FERM BP-3421 TaxID=1494466 RepID=UPI00235F5FD7|nr:BON domain-containing protein [Burkholderia sp. FERM BP-3421]WDD94105.1 BON domain-containing protein [Burkholderia sp. FERM BP-3421]